MLGFGCHSLLAWRAWGASLHAVPLASLPVSCHIRIPPIDTASQYVPETVDIWDHAVSGPCTPASRFLPHTAQTEMLVSTHHHLGQNRFNGSALCSRSLHTSPLTAATKATPPTWTTIAYSDSTQHPSRTTTDRPPQLPYHENTQQSYRTPGPTSSSQATWTATSKDLSPNNQSHQPSRWIPDSAEEDTNSTAYVPGDDAEEMDSPTALPSSYHTLPSTYYRLPPEAPTQGTFPQSVAQRKFNHRVSTMLGVVLASDSVLKERLVEKFGFTVHQVRISKDRKTATVLWDSYPEAVEGCGKELNAHTGRLRAALASALNTKFAPSLTFRHDHLPPHQGKLAETFEQVSTLMALEALSARKEEESPEPESGLSIGAALLQAGMITKTWREREYDGRKARGRTEDWGSGEADVEGGGQGGGKKGGKKHERPVRVHR